MLQKRLHHSALESEIRQKNPKIESCHLPQHTQDKTYVHRHMISLLQRKTDEASVLQKRLHHLALESEGGREKAQAYANTLTPGGSKGRPPSTPSGYRTPGTGRKKSRMSIPGTPLGLEDQENATPPASTKKINAPDKVVTSPGAMAGAPRVGRKESRGWQNHLADVQVVKHTLCSTILHFLSALSALL